jgi:hypothetical protein
MRVVFIEQFLDLHMGQSHGDLLNLLNER